MPFPLATLACTIDDSGISAPSFDQIFTSLRASYQSIFGADAYIDPDSQDGQWLAVIAKGISDCNDACISVYNNFSPAYAQGAGLSAGVKLNGLTRAVPTASTCTVIVSGVVGTTILNGIISDAARAHQWALPASVTIPSAGFIAATATCQDLGAIDAEPLTLTVIVTPTLGWQAVSNSVGALAGNAVETDALLRQRQASSVAFPEVGNVGGLLGALQAISGVSDVAVHENDQEGTNVLGIPAHSVACVIRGGLDATIASTILTKKAPGATTFGSTMILTSDVNGLPATVSFTRPAGRIADVVISVRPRVGYNQAVSDAQIAAVTEYINGLKSGQTLFFGALWNPALLAGEAGALTFDLLTVTLNGGNRDMVVPYNLHAEAGDISVVISS